MNLCNFTKVLIGRSTKDNNCVQWFDGFREKCSQNSAENLEISSPVYDNDISTQKRHLLYQRFVASYPKLHIQYSKFRSVLPRVQTLLSKDGNWLNSNKSGEKNSFIHHYSLQSFFQQPLSSRKNHVLTDCSECIDNDHPFNRLLQKNKQTNIDLYKTCDTITRAFKSNTDSSSTTESAAGVNPVVAATHIINAIKPAFNKQFETPFGIAITKVPNLNVQIKQSENEKKQQKQQSVKEHLKQTCNVAYGDNNENVINFLASGTSYSQYERTRLQTYYEKQETSQEKVKKRLKKENEGTCKKRSAIGKFSSYDFDKLTFLTDVHNRKKGSVVNWTELSKKFNVRNLKGEIPPNGGQVLKLFAEANGIQVECFNVDQPISGRDFERRVRRGKKKLSSGKISIPTPPSSQRLRTSVQEMVSKGELDMGELVAPKVFISQFLQQDGTITSKEVTVHARKISMNTIRQQELKRTTDLGIFRSYPESHYQSLNIEDIRTRFLRIGEDCPDASLHEQQSLLKTIERTRHWKIWHDHSDISNHSHFLIMVSVLYHPSCFLTNEEYKQAHPFSKNVDVQSLVECPQLYLLGRSGSSDADQTMYTEERLNDIGTMTEPILTSDKVPVYDVCRIFSGDGPARQFESGQQRGGNYPCICGVHAENFSNIQSCLAVGDNMSLQERKQLVTAGILWRRMENGILNPFQNLRKDQLTSELEARRIFPDVEGRHDLQQMLTNTLHGIARPPALLPINPSSPIPECLEPYEVMLSEPLHDLTGVINNILQELPQQCPAAKSNLESFLKASVGAKSQTKGCDARLFIVKLLSLAYSLEKSKKIEHNIVELLECLVEITEICYSTENKRNPRQILRFFNLCFKFFILCRAIFSNLKSMSKRRFFGSHFHSITCHAPEMYRIICLRSILAEKEERTFGEIRSMTKSTSNQHPGNIIGNAILRNQAKKHQPSQSFNRQDSAISKQASLLPAFGNTVFKMSTIQNTSLFQSHLQRIADFLLCGKGIWWQVKGTDIEFLDGPSEKTHQEAGPPLSSFISSDLKTEKQQLREHWKVCTTLTSAGQLELPATKIKLDNRVVHLKDIYRLEHEKQTDDNPLEHEMQTDDNRVQENDIYRLEHEKQTDDNPLEHKMQTDDNRVQENDISSSEPMDIDLQSENDGDKIEENEKEDNPTNACSTEDNVVLLIEVGDAIQSTQGDSFRNSPPCKKQRCNQDANNKRELPKTNIPYLDTRCGKSGLADSCNKAKRKLFASCLPEPRPSAKLSSNSAQAVTKKKYCNKSVINQDNIIEMVQTVLDPGDVCSDLEDFKKYHRLLFAKGDKSFQHSYDMAEAHIQTAILRAHSGVKEDIKAWERQFYQSYSCPPDVSDYHEIKHLYIKKRNAQNLMNYWKMYFY